MSTSKRLLHFSILARARRVHVCTMVPVTYHSYPTQIQRQQRQYDIRTYPGGTINTDRCYFFLLLAAVFVRLFAQDGDSCVLALLCGVPLILLQWSILRLSLFGYTVVAAYFFICIQFFSGMFSTRANPGFVRMKQTKTTARLVRPCDTCAHPYLYSTVLLYQVLCYNIITAVLLHVKCVRK